MSYPPVVPFYDVGFLKALSSQSLVHVEAKILSIALSVWFHYKAVSKGGRFDAPPKCQAVVRV